LASEKILEQKQQIVKDLADRMKSSSSGVLVNYIGTNVENDAKLRRDLRNAGINYTVVKNTLLSIACDMIGFEALKDVLTGMTALATSDTDPVAPAKILNDFTKTNENFVLKAGFVEGGIIDAEGVRSLAAIPSKEVLISKILGSLQSSLYSFAYVLQAIIDKNGGGFPVAAEEAAS